MVGVAFGVAVGEVLADAVVALHFAFLLFVAFGALALRRLPMLAWAHVPAVAWGALSITVGLPCPLTGLEKRLRDEPYPGGFVDHYLEGVLLPQALTPVLWALAAVVIAVGYTRGAGGLRRTPSKSGPCLDSRSP